MQRRRSEPRREGNASEERERRTKKDQRQEPARPGDGNVGCGCGEELSKKCGAVRSGAVWCSVVQYGAVWCSMVPTAEDAWVVPGARVWDEGCEEDPLCSENWLGSILVYQRWIQSGVVDFDLGFLFGGPRRRSSVSLPG